MSNSTTSRICSLSNFGGDFTDVANGRDFTIEVEKENVGGREVNKVTSIRIKPKTSQLSEDAELVNKLLEEQPDILSINRKYKYDKRSTSFF